MAHELVLEPKPVLVDDAVLVHDDRVIKTAAQRQLIGAQRLDILEKAEGSGARDLPEEGGGRKVERCALMMPPQHGVIELDLQIDSEPVVRLDARPLVPFADLDRADDADEALVRRLLLDAGRLDQKYESCRAAVHDRHLRSCQVDKRIVDA